MKKFAFIVHLRAFEDIVYVLPVPKFLVSMLKYPILYLFSKLKGRIGFSVRSKFKIGKDAEGYILLIWLTGEQIMSTNRAHKVRSRILEATLYAQNRLQCNVIGLGALTASVTDSGRWLANRPEVKAAITHGDSYSVCVSTEGVQKVAEITGLNLSKATIAVVGATGIVGEGLVYQLAPLVRNGLILIGRNSKKLEAVKFEAEKLGSHPTISLDIEDVREADIVVTATSWPKAILETHHLKEGAIVYEVSQPRNAAWSIPNERPDIVIIDGAYTKIPKSIKFWWMSLPSHTTFACMAETMMQALEGDLQNHVGKVDPVFVKEVERRAKQYGFSHAPFTSFNKIIEDKQLLDITDKKRKGREKNL